MNQARILASGAKADDDWPLLVVQLAGSELARRRIDAAVTRAYDVPLRLDRGRQTLELAFVNDLCKPPEDP